MTEETLIQRRARLMGPNVPTFYKQPVHLVRGEGVWLWDADGKRYLDCYNNVPHVGHCHPRVVQALCDQAGTLNTHTRYLHDGVLDLIERLTATFTPTHGLSQAIIVCTGSEANDIALRMAQAVTGKTGIIATDATYHGNTMAVSQLSTRKPPIGGRWPNVRLVPAPDTRRNDGGARFAAHVKQAMADLDAAGFGTSGLLICPMFANEGMPMLAPGFLSQTEAALRAAGALIIADEVQPGFGRAASHFWGHQKLGFRPDIVTMGKPMGNGHPVAAVATTPATMAAFREAFSYFNTFGGNPVSAAVALAVLDVIRDEGLMERAQATSAHMLGRLRALRHPLLADVRANGLFFAAEFMTGDAPATRFTADLVENMVARGFLMNVIGAGRNILKVRPPLPFGIGHADLVMDALETALRETPVAA
jgi:4-aminobutyrate aminotransferase-like enzyme